MPGAKHITSPTPYASTADFDRIFHEQKDSLYRLSFVLTADQAKAQQCFVSGLEDSVKGNPVFKEWARSWAGGRSFRAPFESSTRDRQKSTMV